MEGHGGWFKKSKRIRPRRDADQAVDKARIPKEGIKLLIEVAVTKGTDPDVINHSIIRCNARRWLAGGVYVESRARKTITLVVAYANCCGSMTNRKQTEERNIQKT